VKFLVDSDVIIWALRGRPETVELLRSIHSIGVAACSPISIIEVKAGARGGEEKNTGRLLEALEVIPVDARVANKAGDYIRQYRQQGITLAIPDAIIAATCTLHELTLVTYNTRHYPIPDIRFHPTTRS
jgi:hypothetical protein